MGVPADEPLHTFVTSKVKIQYKHYPKLFIMYKIRKEYTRRGGEYVEATIDGQRARRLFERWVEVIPFLKKGHVVDCTEKTYRSKCCRPMHRLDEDTPTTLPELLRVHNRHDILQMARRANKNPEKRVRWEDLEFDAFKTI